MRNPRDLVKALLSQKTDADRERLMAKWLSEAKEEGRWEVRAAQQAEPRQAHEA